MKKWHSSLAVRRPGGEWNKMATKLMEQLVETKAELEVSKLPF